MISIQENTVGDQENTVEENMIDIQENTVEENTVEEKLEEIKQKTSKQIRNEKKSKIKAAHKAIVQLRCNLERYGQEGLVFPQFGIQENFIFTEKEMEVCEKLFDIYVDEAFSTASKPRNTGKITNKIFYFGHGPLYKFIKKGDFGKYYENLIQVNSENLIDQVPLLKKGYGSLDSINDIFLIYIHHHNLKHKNKNSFQFDDLLLRCFDSDIPPLFIKQIGKTKSTEQYFTCLDPEFEKVKNTVEAFNLYKRSEKLKKFSTNNFMIFELYSLISFNKLSLNRLGLLSETMDAVYKTKDFSEALKKFEEIKMHFDEGEDDPFLDEIERETKIIEKCKKYYQLTRQENSANA